jgi:outer membrane immunogenic protein
LQFLEVGLALTRGSESRLNRSWTAVDFPSTVAEMSPCAKPIRLKMRPSRLTGGGSEMKNLLVGCVALAALSCGANAADLPVKAARMAAPVAYSWAGFYIGGNAGYDWTKSTDTITAGGGAAPGLINFGSVATSLPLDPSGFIGGGQIGYNWQPSAMWVAGFEADLQWANLNSTVSLPGPNDRSRIMTASEKLDWLGTVRGRVGVTPSERALIYVTGGLAYGHANLSTALTRVSLATGANTCVVPGGGANNCENGSVTDTKVGWTIGGGLEWAMIGNWSLKAEYLYYDLGNISHGMADPNFPTTTFNASADLKGSIARVGLNHRFDWGGPVMTKY